MLLKILQIWGPKMLVTAPSVVLIASGLGRAWPVCKVKTDPREPLTFSLAWSQGTVGKNSNPSLCPRLSPGLTCMLVSTCVRVRECVHVALCKPHPRAGSWILGHSWAPPGIRCSLSPTAFGLRGL